MERFVSGAIQSPSDHRDFIYSQIIPLGEAPSEFLLEEFPVRDQGSFGTCIGQAAAGIKDYQEHKERGAWIKTSPLFIYARCKELDGEPGMQGTYPRIAMKVLKDYGICHETTFPYELLKDPFKLPSISKAVYDDAGQFKIGAYARIQSLAEVKQALMREGPVMGCILVCQNFFDPESYKFIPMPQGTIEGGHGLKVSGWNDNLKYNYKNGTTLQGFLRCRNSWGEGWGDNGYCWIPYAYFNGRADIGTAFWMESWSSVDIILPGPAAQRQIIITPGKTTAIVDGTEISLDQPAVIDPKSGRTLIPLRFISENMGWKVVWDGTKVIMTK